MDIVLHSGGAYAWVVVHTHPNRERVAIENLQRQEFATYCPMIVKRVRHARRIQDVQRPLFPGYVLVKIAREIQQWRPILSTIGVRNVVRFGEKLSYLDDRFVASLRQREVDGLIKRPEAPYSIGQSVRMAGGPFDGLVASIIEMQESDRLVVLMEMLNGRVKVKVDADKVTTI